MTMSQSVNLSDEARDDGSRLFLDASMVRAFLVHVGCDPDVDVLGELAARWAGP